MRSKFAWTVLIALLATVVLQGCSSGGDTAKTGVPLLPGDLKGPPGGNHGHAGGGPAAPPATN